MKKNLHEHLKELPLPPVPAPDEERKRQTFETARHILQVTRKQELLQRTRFRAFFLQQLSYVGWRVWLRHGALLLAALLFAARMPADASAERWQLLALLSTVSPLLALIGMRMLARSYAFHMVELEMSTFYSIERLFLSRLCLFALTDFVGLTCLAGWFSVEWEQQLGHLLLYLFTPFTVSAAGCLWLFNQARIRDKASACSGFIAILLVFQVVSSFRLENGGGLNELLYGGTASGVWLAVLVLSILTAASQLQKLLHSFRRLESGDFL
ncbi:hypothetical protein [Gorillibacterium sp. CAU 1737]|uniref:hypothetical protein n=1 Tax=Gorillibacterium sp. CAU 1737 TaxID=3140362 RepID=UPI003260D5BF